MQIIDIVNSSINSEVFQPSHPQAFLSFNKDLY